MKKLLAILVLTAAITSQASELWFMMNGVSYGDGTATVSDGINGGDITWTTARLWANTTGYNYGGEAISEAISASELKEFGDAYFTFSDDYANSSYSFYVELLNGETSVGKTYISSGNPPKGAANYRDIAGAVSQDIMDVGGTSPYSGFSNFSTSNVIPEPTSGLLLAIGMMMLGLKRKRT